MTTIILEAFPDTSLTIISAKVCDFPALRRVVESSDVAAIDARMVLDTIQIVSAACKVLAARSSGSMLTSKVASEVVYRLSGSGNVPEKIYQEEHLCLGKRIFANLWSFRKLHPCPTRRNKHVYPGTTKCIPAG